MKFRLLTALLLSLTTGATAQSLSGAIEGTPSADTRLSGWAVKSSGQPAKELVSIPLKAGTFTIALPIEAPAANLQGPVDNRITWPGLVDFDKASAAAQATEMKFFIYRDTNANGERDENEPLKEVRLNVGKGFLFVVWGSNDVNVSGSNGYNAELKKGWNAFTVDVRSTVSVKPLDPKTTLQINIGK